MSSEEEARKEASKLFKEAESYLVSKSSFFSLFSSSANYFDAAEAYNRAGNILKAAKIWKEAGEAYVLAAETEIKGGEADASARKFINAASCYKKIEPKKAIDCLEKANESFLKNGRFHAVATHEKEIAEIYENQLSDLPLAIKLYLSAADRFSIDESNAIAQGCSIKAANLAAKSGNYEQAAQLFEENAEACVGDNLRQYSIKDYLLRAGLCQLCLDDLVGARKAFDRFGRLDFSFEASKEAALLREIADACESGDLEQFTEIVTKWDRTNVVDEWKTDILLKIKQSIDEEPSLT